MNDLLREAPIDGYDDASLTACERALCTVLSRIGPWGERLFLIGGLVPRYLVPEIPEGIEEHVGTTDVDLVVGVVVDSEEGEPYRTLQSNLEDAGFEIYQDEKGQKHSDQWVREIDGLTVKLEFFCPPNGGTPGGLRRNPRAEGQARPGANLSARRLKGADLVATDAAALDLERETLDGGGVRTVVVRVANIAPFLTIKAFALSERVKDKDAYDIVWLLNAHEDGPGGAATAVRASPVSEHPLLHEALDLLEKLFTDETSPGPAQYARFFVGPDDVETDLAARLRRDALGTVRKFLDSLGD